MTEPRTIGALVEEGRRALAVAPHRPPRREATLLLARVLGLGEAQVMARDREPVAEADMLSFRALLARRVAGEPVAYLFGEREFYGRPFTVDRRVLIPRPETEHLIEAVLALDLPRRPRILDVGTGSGAIAVTLAAELPRSRVVASDLSLDALRVARGNAHRHGVAPRVPLVRADLTTACELATVDVLASNPPYVAAAALPSLSAEVTAWEPHLALVAGDQAPVRESGGAGAVAQRRSSPGGTEILARLLVAGEALRPGAWLVLEIGYDQGAWLTESAAQRPHLELRELIKDLAGHPRTAVLQRV